LRLWHGKDGRMLLIASLPHFVDNIPYAAIGEAESLDGIVAALRGTPYAGPIAEASAAYQEKQSVFYLETALEKDYYRHLLAAVNALGGADARVGIAAIGAEIDMLNLAWIARRLQYQYVSFEDAASALIPGPAGLSQELAAPGLTEEKLGELSEKHIGRVLPGTGDARSSLQRLSMLEQVLSEMAASSAMRQFMLYPFNIGCVYAFYILIRLELKNLCTVFAGTAAGLAERDIEARWRGGR
jgi:vacuolar-type H+-ATPase subunit C/Vma6